MNWYTVSQQRKRLFVVEFRPDRSPNTAPQTKNVLLENEEQARGFVRRLFPRAVILSVKESNKYRVRFSPDFNTGAKDTAEEVIADSPEQAKEIILKKYPNATFNGEPINLGIEPPKTNQLPSASELNNQRRLERRVFEPWETDNPNRRNPV